MTDASSAAQDLRGMTVAEWSLVLVQGTLAFGIAAVRANLRT